MFLMQLVYIDMYFYAQLIMQKFLEVFPNGVILFKQDHCNPVSLTLTQFGTYYENSNQEVGIVQSSRFY